MNRKIIQLPQHSPLGEKRGNTSWLTCNSCNNWFHATCELIEKDNIKLHCPSCHNEFFPKESNRIILA
tara:strand:+ start:297 stop:500 length:204 start_codon:yes stop_codon:yes gene_type:complete